MTHATAEGTQRYAERHGEKGLFRTAGRTGLTISVLGFGCYRVNSENPEYREALNQALRGGCNVIDTSTNYADGDSETLVGQVLKEYPRDEILVVSKVGYVQGGNLELAMQREKEGKPFPEMVKYMDGCWHCIHPQFIQEQLSLTLQRTGLSQVDSYLLHNPEYFFSDAKKRASRLTVDELRDEFYRRVRAAFIQLESEVAAGRIRTYGVSSNTFGKAESAPDMTSISRMWAIAKEVGGDQHHFSFVQLPANLFETGPMRERNNDGKTALEFAKEKDLAVLVNRPLNAVVGDHIVRLADFQVADVEGNVADQAARVAHLEQEFGSKFAPMIQTEGVSAHELFRWGTELSHAHVETIPLEHWNDLETQMIRPQVGYLVTQLDAHFKAQPAWNDWRGRYGTELERLLSLVRNGSAKRSRDTSRKIAAWLDPLLPESTRNATLSQKALYSLIHTPGVTCVLNGMRKPSYVKNSLGAARLAPFTVDPETFFKEPVLRSPQ